jgi:uncharacterized protein
MPSKPLKVLSMADIQVPFLYSPRIKEVVKDIDLVIDCGDLPYYYLEYVLNALQVDLYFVRGNHSFLVEHTETGDLNQPRGGIDLHHRVLNARGLLIAGVQGSLRYRPGPFQYTQDEFWWFVFSLIPSLLRNRMRFGRYLDVFVTHAPPWGIHDQEDLPHQGIHAFRWFDRVFQPGVHLHGHIHVYRPDTATVTQFGKTQVINTFGYRITEMTPGILPVDGLDLQAQKK